MTAPRRGARRAIAAGATLASAAVLLALGAGPSLASVSMDRGVALAPWNSELRMVSALRAMQRRDERSARGHALSSLKAMPFNQVSLTIVAAGLTGQPAIDALNQSAALGWRDPVTNLRLIQAGFAERAPTVTAQRIDALARVTGTELVGVMADQLLTMPGGLEAMADRAAHHGERSWILAWLAMPPATSDQLALRRALLDKLDIDDGAWRRQAIAAAILGFGAAKRQDMAYEAWRSLLADPSRWREGIYDPTFAGLGRAGATGGEWRTNARPAAMAETLPRSGLSLTYTGAELGQVISQFVEFPVGPFHLVARWAGAGADVSAYEWTAQCSGGAPIGLSRTVAREGTGWRDTYESGAPGCRHGWLGLKLVRPPSSERQVTLRSVALRQLP